VECQRAGSVTLLGHSGEVAFLNRNQQSSLRAMDSERRMPNVRDIWRLALAVIGVVAIVQELRKPSDERTWHGKVADFVPYDFRMPTIGRVRSTFWNPEGPIFPGKVFGVGWALNFGVLTRMLGKRQAGVDSNPNLLTSSQAKVEGDH